jgi:hypothetical protein
MFTLDGVIMILISYYMIGFPSPSGVSSFFSTIGFCLLIELSAASVGVMISSVVHLSLSSSHLNCLQSSPSYAVAISIAGPLLTVFSITGGLFTNIAKMPSYVRWVQYLSW